MIINTVTGKFYIGSSKNTMKRWKTHKSSLARGTHHNIYLQRSYDKHGEEAFLYQVIETLPDDTEKSFIFERERYYIDTMKPEYNIGAVGGGDNFTNNPDKERIREIHRENLEKLRLSGKIPPTKSGSENPNWKGAVHTTCACGASKSHGNKQCSVCHDSTGDKNPFYGKKHTEATKLKINSHLKGKPNLRDSKRIMANYQEYRSLTFAAECMGVCVGTILYRLKKGWEGYAYL